MIGLQVDGYEYFFSERGVEKISPLSYDNLGAGSTFKVSVSTNNKLLFADHFVIVELYASYHVPSDGLGYVRRRCETKGVLAEYLFQAGRSRSHRENV